MPAPLTSRAERPGSAPAGQGDAVAPGELERFRPGGVLHALTSGLLEAALASVLLGLSLRAGEGAAASLTAAALLWAVLAAYSLAVAALRGRVWAAELDADGVVLRRLGGTRRWRYDELSAVEVGRGRTRLVDREGRAHRVRGVRGLAQAHRFRARVLARATVAAARRRPPGEDAGPAATPRAEG
ncbi:MAG TPA: hypothetical protein VGM21_08430 [Actinomycetota bacterium]